MKRKTVALSGMISCGLMTGGLAGMLATGALGFSPLSIVATAVFTLCTLLFFFMGALTNIRGGQFQLEPKDVQASYGKAFLTLPGSLLILAAVNFGQLWRLWDQPDQKLRWVLAVSTAVSVFASVWGLAFLLSGRNRQSQIQRLIQDEVFQSNLAMARSDGFYAALVALTLCFFVGMISPQWAISLIPLATVSTLSYPGWRFHRRDKRALAAEDISRRSA